MTEYTEEDLFSDEGGNEEFVEGGDAGALAGEQVDTSAPPAAATSIDDDVDEDVDDVPPVPPAGEAGDQVELSGVERFLSNYGINGGLITYEDGEAVPFADLSPEEQEEVLSSLTKEAVPAVEEKYNLDQSEIDLLNAIREQDTTPEEFVNNIVDHRLNYALSTKEAINEDFNSMPEDSVFMRHLVDTVVDITADEAAEELAKAKEMSTYGATVNSLRDNYMTKQKALVEDQKNISDKEFSKELEFQRADVVKTIEGINDIAGAAVSDDMKEYLLHDMMELNDANDPLLMEKIFSEPENMFKANWFLTYGEDYIKNLNDYWKKEVSKATKNSYYNATRDMPGKPIARGFIQNGPTSSKGGNVDYGGVVSEEDLFNE